MPNASQDRETSRAAAPGYRSFLLRCWQEPGAGPGGAPAWRFVLVQLDGEETRKGFARLEELCAYLRGELERGA
jgi:hypothetical protein